MKEQGLEHSVSITELSHCIVVTPPDNLTDRDLLLLAEKVMKLVYLKEISGAVFDFSLVSVLDSFALTKFQELAKGLHLLGTHIVWTGLRPETVCTIIDLNMESDEMLIRTAVDLESAIELLEKGM